MRLKISCTTENGAVLLHLFCLQLFVNVLVYFLFFYYVIVFLLLNKLLTVNGISQLFGKNESLLTDYSLKVKHECHPVALCVLCQFLWFVFLPVLLFLGAWDGEFTDSLQFTDS